MQLEMPVSVSEISTVTLRHPELYRQSVFASAGCILCSEAESDAFKSADDVKWNANKYVIIWLSK